MVYICIDIIYTHTVCIYTYGMYLYIYMIATYDRYILIYTQNIATNADMFYSANTQQYLRLRIAIHG